MPIPPSGSDHRLRWQHLGRKKKTAVAVDLVVLRCSSGAATYRVRAAKVRMYNARRVCAVRVAAALEHYKICHVWLPTSRKTACRVRLRSNSIARPVSSCFRLTYCYRSTVKWLYGGSIHTQKRTHETYSKAPSVEKPRPRGRVSTAGAHV